MTGAGLSCIISTISPSLLALMTQEMDPTVKDWLGLGANGELGKHIIWFAMRINTHTPTCRANYRRNIVDSPPRGIPTIVDCVVEVSVVRN
jgi:hypothetical protein